MNTLRKDLPRLRHDQTELDRIKLFSTFTQEMSDFVSACSEKRKSIIDNPDWSEQGKQKRIAELDKTFRPGYDDFARRLKNIEQQFAGEAQAHKSRSYSGTGNPLLDYLESREIRDRLASMSPAEQLQMVLKPANDPTGKFLHAVECSPMPMQGFTQDILTRAHEARDCAFSPQGEAVLGDQAIVLETLKYNLGEVGKALAVDSPAAKTD